MNVVPVWYGRVSDYGELVLPEAYKELRKNYLLSLAGEDIEMIIRKRRTKRSSDQNRYIHAAATILANEFGNDLDEMKLILMGEKWGWHHSALAGREVPIKPHTSAMTVDEAREFIEWLPRWALSHGISIGLPGEIEAGD